MKNKKITIVVEYGQLGSLPGALEPSRDCLEPWSHHVTARGQWGHSRVTDHGQWVEVRLTS